MHTHTSNDMRWQQRKIEETVCKYSSERTFLSKWHCAHFATIFSFVPLSPPLAHSFTHWLTHNWFYRKNRDRFIRKQKPIDIVCIWFGARISFAFHSPRITLKIPSLFYACLPVDTLYANLRKIVWIPQWTQQKYIEWIMCYNF